MNVLAPIVDPLRRLGLEGWGGLRPSYPPVAVEVGPTEVVLVRIKSRRGGRLTLDACQVRRFDIPSGPQAVGRVGVGHEDLTTRMREVFEAGGTKPGKISLVLPDSMAKVSLLGLPERPTSSRQLDEMVRFKLRRAVPFRLEDAALAYQLLPGEGPEATVLVAAMPRAAVEPFERALVGIGARPGLVSLCTTNLFNLWRAQIDKAGASGDVALLNCTSAYFSLLIVRSGRLIFYRCKALVLGEEDAPAQDGLLERELASSFSYYEEKLAGTTIATAFVRTVSRPFEEVATALSGLGVAQVEPLDPAPLLAGVAGNGMDAPLARKIAPALGAAVGWR